MKKREMRDGGRSVRVSAMIKKTCKNGTEKWGKWHVAEENNRYRTQGTRNGNVWSVGRLVLPHLPTRIMKVVRPRSIPRQRALPTLGDTVLCPIARTLTSLMLPLRLLLLL